MKQFIIHLLFLVVLCLVLSTCKHEPEPDPPAICQYDSSIEEMKKWYYFKTGTWWVYEEQTTGELDTVTVYFDQSSGGGQVGSFEWEAYSSFDGYNYYYFFTSSNTIYCLNQPECDCHKVNRAKGMPGEFVGDSDLFLWPIIEGNYNNIYSNISGQITSGTTTVTSIDGLFVVGLDTINNVAEWTVTTDDMHEGFSSKYYFAKDIGIVQFEHQNDNSIWKLIEYQITP
ncbi:MAG: hypothetical protein ACKVOK_14340 [Flavobacteriales bacterium]